MVQLTEVSSGLFSSETRSCCPLCFEMLPLQISNSLAGSLHQLPDSIYPQQAVLRIHAKGEMAAIAFCCCFSILMVLFIQTAVSFSNRKESTRLLFLYGVLSGKTACNKFMHRDQGFHSKTQSFFPFFFFFIFRFVFGPFY